MRKRNTKVKEGTLGFSCTLREDAEIYFSLIRNIPHRADTLKVIQYICTGMYIPYIIAIP